MNPGKNRLTEHFVCCSSESGDYQSSSSSFSDEALNVLTHMRGFANLLQRGEKQLSTAVSLFLE